ncbi:MAG: hypothetical protein B5M55_07205 [Desulfococcus sp. 4484_242]|nr:MAG: hypothetical protein B5M55_07205 [Desulfococcus sp. 4484_242]
MIRLEFAGEPAVARRKKRKKRSGSPRPPKDKPVIFNPLKGNFAALKEISGKPEDRKEVLRKQPETGRSQSEDRYFLEIMSDVDPLPGSGNRVVRVPDPDTKPAHAAGNEELAVLSHLSDLVCGAEELDITFTDEYIEGAVAGVTRKLMQQLKRGRIPVQDYVDLHGLTKRGAEIRVREFLLRSFRLGLRCVLIVHGRGLNSEDHIPILKERLPVWLKRGPIRKIVLAFSTAQPYDGGAGALYVLLKRRRRRLT